MPPDVDNKALARQKRRRTSKEDEDVLKAEYQKNPKPDKAARLDIVSKVALGEKEVQIWFQNKRQNDRRRSRPLEPSSTASLMSSSSTMSDPATEDEALTRHLDSVPEPEECPASDPPEQPTTPQYTSDETAQQPHAQHAHTFALETPITTDSIPEPTTESQPADTVPTELSDSQQAAPSSQGASQPRTSWISNRRSASFVRNNEDYAPECITFPHAPTTLADSPQETRSAHRSLKRTHSFVRIATNEDGSARIVTDLDKTPSPPHAKTNPAVFSRAAAGLRRSYSAAGLNERLVAAARGESSPKMPRTLSSVGRSRDSRAWEFWCDPDSRSATSLTTRAEQEGSGSAADAIGILRANRRVLAQNHTRQNTPLKRGGSHKLLGSPCVKKSRGSMQRASTISGRFSTEEHKKSGDTTESDEFPETTSDKENWEPDFPKSVRRDRQVAVTPPASRAARQILGENTEVLSQASSLGAMLAREKRKGVKVLNDPEQDDELRQFMDGDGMSARTSLSSAEEAGCVEGLLKLSQGQWK
ncbi:Homeobox protein yox1 [Coniothyrium glycines]